MPTELFPRPVLFSAVSVVLPAADDTLLLRACLSSGEAAHRSWLAWQRRIDEHGSAPFASHASIRKLALLVFDAVRRSGFAIDSRSQTYLRSAYLKEELRTKIFRRILRDLL